MVFSGMLMALNVSSISFEILEARINTHDSTSNLDIIEDDTTVPASITINWFLRTNKKCSEAWISHANNSLGSYLVSADGSIVGPPFYGYVAQTPPSESNNFTISGTFVVQNGTHYHLGEPNVVGFQCVPEIGQPTVFVIRTYTARS